MEEQRVPVELRGMDQSSRDGQDADLIENMVWDERGLWRTAPGAVRVGTEPTGEVLAMAWLELAGGQQRKLLIEEAVTDTTSRLVVLQLPAGTVRVVQASRPRGRVGAVMVPVGGWLWVLAQDAEPVKWNGTTLERIGFDKAPSPPSVTGGDQGYDDCDRFNAGETAGSYQYATNRQRGIGSLPESGTSYPWSRGYRITVLNQSGQESPPSEMVFASGTNRYSATSFEESGRRIAEVVVPLQPSHVRGVRLWATTDLAGQAVQGAPVALHSEWHHGAGLRTIDSMGDSELGLELDASTLGRWPAGATLACEWGGRSWVAGTLESPNRLRYSAPGLPEQLPEDNFLPVGGQDTGGIRCLYPTQTALLVFCTRGTFIVKDSSAPRIDTLSTAFGVESPRGVAEAPGLGVVGLSRSGPFLVVGALQDQGYATRVVPVRGAQKLWRRVVNHHRLDTVVAATNASAGELWFQLPQAGDARPTLGLVLHYATGRMSWSTRTNWPVSALATSQRELWFGSWSSSNPGVYVVSEGYDAVAGTTVSGLYRTGWLSPTRELFEVLAVRVHGLAVGSGTVALQHRGHHEWQTSMGAVEQTSDYDGNLPAWGTASWSTDELYEELLDNYVDHHVASGVAHRVQLELAGEHLFVRHLELVVSTDDGDDRAGPA